MKTWRFTFKCEYFGAEFESPFYVDADTYHDATILADAYVKEKFPIACEQELATIKFEGLGIDPKDWGKSKRELQEPCDYCDMKTNSKILLSSSGNVRLLIMKQAGVEYYDDGYGWQDETMEINYCPMCGRKMEVEG